MSIEPSLSSCIWRNYKIFHLLCLSRDESFKKTYKSHFWIRLIPIQYNLSQPKHWSLHLWDLEVSYLIVLGTKDRFATRHWYLVSLDHFECINKIALHINQLLRLIAILKSFQMTNKMEYRTIIKGLQDLRKPDHCPLYGVMNHKVAWYSFIEDEEWFGRPTHSSVKTKKCRFRIISKRKLLWMN